MLIGRGASRIDRTVSMELSFLSHASNTSPTGKCLGTSLGEGFGTRKKLQQGCNRNTRNPWDFSKIGVLSHFYTE